MINFAEPFENRLQNSNNILLAGVGGGFDLLSCLPLYYKLIAEGKQVTLVNYSNLDLDELNAATDPQVILKDRLFMVGSNMKQWLQHYPSGMVSMWFEQTYNEQVPVYLMLRQSIRQLKECYQKVIDKHEIDTIIFCGYGMTSIMMGDEEGCGNMLHSTINEMAVKDLEVPNKLLVTFGVETSMRGKVSYNSVLDNIALHTQWKTYLGLAFMYPEDDSFLYMKHCYDFIASKEHHERSNMIELILLGVHGKVGKFKEDKITPLMAHIHCFDLQGVCNANKLGMLVEHLDSYDEIVQHGMSTIQNGNKPRRFIYPEI